jgi:hypothetical protein
MTGASARVASLIREAGLAAAKRRSPKMLPMNQMRAARTKKKVASTDPMRANTGAGGSHKKPLAAPPPATIPMRTIRVMITRSTVGCLYSMRELRGLADRVRFAVPDLSALSMLVRRMPSCDGNAHARPGSQENE